MSVPAIRIFDSLTPANFAAGDSVLCYPNLDNHIQELSVSHRERTQRVWDSPLGSSEEENAARQLAFEYLVRTAGKLVVTNETDMRNLWAERYNLAAGELFEKPQTPVVIDLMRRHEREVRMFVSASDKALPAAESLLGIYGRFLPDSLGDEAEVESLSEAEIQRAVGGYKAELLRRYGYIFDLVAASGRQQFGPEELKVLFKEAITALAEKGNQGWEDWEVVYKNTRTLSVDHREKKIEIGTKRKPASAAKARELLAHELLVHALRANNAALTGNTLLLEGLVGYADAEEGLGKLAEHAISGKKPPTSADHYVDIGLACGVINGVQLNRHEVFELAVARKIVRAQMSGKYSKLVLSTLLETTAASVDRIYYGTPGDTLPARQAVYISETNYYGGYRKILKYIIDAQNIGTPMEDIFDFINQGKFDPTNPKHLEYLNKR